MNRERHQSSDAELVAPSIFATRYATFTLHHFTTVLFLVPGLDSYNLNTKIYPTEYRIRSKMGPSSLLEE